MRFRKLNPTNSLPSIIEQPPRDCVVDKQALLHNVLSPTPAANPGRVDSTDNDDEKLHLHVPGMENVSMHLASL